jgi:hypothetical protein
MEGWTCPICLDDDEINKSKVYHECGRHDFHQTCLETNKKRDIRCPVCRFNPKIKRIKFHAIINYLEDLNDDEKKESKKCVHCLQDLNNEFTIHCNSRYRCKHFAHSSCMVDNLIENGANLPDKAIFCPMCHHHPITPILKSYNTMLNEFEVKVKPQLIHVIGGMRKACSYCLCYIDPSTIYYNFCQCDHYLHSQCAIASLSDEGMDSSGSLFCRECHYDGLSS